MTLQNIFKRLTDIDRLTQTLIRDIGMDDDCELESAIAPNRTDPDETFLFNNLCNLMSLLHRLHQELLYLLMPCGDVHVSRMYTNGRYGYDVRPSGDVRTFTCGSPLEALIHDADGNPYWASSRIEHNGTGYYLYGYSDIPLDGLTIRERGCAE